jgi:hypothetical protein
VGRPASPIRKIANHDFTHVAAVTKSLMHSGIRKIKNRDFTHVAAVTKVTVLSKAVCTTLKINFHVVHFAFAECCE